MELSVRNTSGTDLVSALRRAAGSALPEGARLLRDREDALWAVRSASEISIPGYTAVRRGEYLAFYPGEELFRLVEDFINGPNDPFLTSFSRFRGFSPESSSLFSSIIKAREAGDPAALAALEKALRQSAARALREGGGEGLYCCAVALRG